MRAKVVKFQSFGISILTMTENLHVSNPRYRLLDEYPSEPYTDVYWIKYVSIQAARAAKRKLDNRPFFGRDLHICYAPEFESVQDTREKLQQRRKTIAHKTRGTVLAGIFCGT